jgi:hypothetical protein
MGIFDDDESEEEVQIRPNQEFAGNEGRLKSEVESKVVSDNGETGSTVSSVASGSQVSQEDSSKSIDIEDVYRQNERIIELLEEISSDEDTGDEQDFSGDVDGVL